MLPRRLLLLLLLMLLLLLCPVALESQEKGRKQRLQVLNSAVKVATTTATLPTSAE